MMPYRHGSIDNGRMESMRLSVVINTWNEEANIGRCIASIKAIADEIVVIDMESVDGTKKRAEALGAIVYNHPQTGYVEPARNFALSKATGDWILLLDADEEIPAKLASIIEKTIQNPSEYNFYRIPRKNISFDKWIKHGMWWPDYKIRLFQKGAVEWNELIHSIPQTRGNGSDFPSEEGYAIIHHNYQSVSQFIDRLNRYTSEQALERYDKNSSFHWNTLIKAPSDEFLRRFFSSEGYKDGFHGLSLSLLQAFSELVVILKLWEKYKFTDISEKTIQKEFYPELVHREKEFRHWLIQKKFTSGILSKLHSLLS